MIGLSLGKWLGRGGFESSFGSAVESLGEGTWQIEFGEVRAIVSGGIEGEV